MNDSTDIPEFKCLTCHYKMDKTSPAFGGGKLLPEKDDLSVCIKCGTVTKFDDHLNAVALTERELKELMNTHPDVYLKIRRVQSAIHQMNKSN